MRSQKKYTKDFKIQVCKLVLDKNKSVPQLAKAVNIASQTIYRWLKEYQDYGEDAFVGSGYLRSSEAKLKQLQKANEKLRMENDILKKQQHTLLPFPRESRIRQKRSKGVSG